ncbi:MAG: hypothetical protein A3E87_07060 [Gammaproteobacteria bacterium RIFCSPHIGHO2_12_FULL_35_23]|nr:MAG: hypothetical protein A3E87_07060 [Gammaproteobacteria bacterium RIFCSPHIGHO2_12_FULL_35_23]
MNRVSVWINFFLNRWKHHLAYFLINFKHLPVNIVRVYRDERSCQNIIILQLIGTRFTLCMPLQMIAGRILALTQLHPLETMLIQLLAKEELHNNGYHGIDLEHIELQLSCFACIEKQFFCKRTKKVMVVICPPWQDQQLCLPISTLINEVRLLAVLKSLSWAPESPVIFNWSRKPIMLIN